ncbi:hypothetical protein J2S17_001067 [Cytobacillus purgationiresistens]|uniref:vWA found in TerF C terminus domain-containing protein n=1 Tax=Cytobacillus purgationiresistens TaxID=863449 RepID=A0ABU0AEH7_9BACI|nr:hypothetical protein [Cytobacillus purgationiresistens]
MEKLDAMEGRFIDNANFFHIDKIETTTDEQLYEMLLGEFPDWLKKAKEKKVI